MPNQLRRKVEECTVNGENFFTLTKDTCLADIWVSSCMIIDNTGLEDMKIINGPISWYYSHHGCHKEKKK